MTSIAPSGISLVAPAALSTAGQPNAAPGYERTQLANGMTVISQTMQSVRSVSLGLWFSVGSRDEALDEAGLSHFMEHMMFKGTAKHSAAEISKYFDALGAEINAFTSKEYTCYYSRCVDTKVEEALSMLAEMVITSQFSPETIAPEREVVVEEIARAYDTPDDYVFDLYSQSTLPNHAVGLPVLGRREAVEHYEHQHCVAYLQKHYHAGNLVLAAAGNINHETLVELAERLFAPMPAGVRHIRALQPAQALPGIFTATRSIEQAHILYGGTGLPMGHGKRYVAAVLFTILGGTMSSRLFQKIREERGLVYTITAGQSTYQGLGEWFVYAGTRPENIAEVTQLVQGELERIATDVVPEAELTRTKNVICGQLLLGLETTSANMSRLGKREVVGLPQTSADEQAEAYRAVTAAEIRELAQQLFDCPRSIACVSPYSEEEARELLQ